jgi:hypothetical protein
MNKKLNGLIAFYVREDPLRVCDVFVVRTVSRLTKFTFTHRICSEYSVFAHLRGYSDSTTPPQTKYRQ